LLKNFAISGAHSATTTPISTLMRTTALFTRSSSSRAIFLAWTIEALSPSSAILLRRAMSDVTIAIRP